MTIWQEAIVSALLLLGSVFTLVGAIGLFRLPDFFMRLHGPTKSTTLGVGGVVVASVIAFSSREHALSLHELLLTAFLFLTAPVSAHMLAKAAIQQRLPTHPLTRDAPELADDAFRDDAFRADTFTDDVREPPPSERGGHG
ncbi:Na+/H+ antiporter subunit G [Cupriavidus sp. AU9028]|uniref:Na+/H+ antiporter subunit G n=1 Tax=Cupriavidus sp. AU9028 TaxID=2871157 RepID=UPI001C97E2C1|nr:Na+/H+ antiporter subunit G [Cupriavidus sp. AU9028]MBY4895966.1 Na+/H+ antiporter subunit G [Cupriavidus sp. AU9028]